MSWQVEPYVGVGPARLGATRAELERALGGPSVPVDRGDPLPTAVFAGFGVQAHFAADGRVEAIELTAPAAPELVGLALLTTPYARVLAVLRDHDPGLAVDATGLTAPALGTGVYAPSAREHPHRPAEGVIVFVRGYYDS